MDVQDVCCGTASASTLLAWTNIVNHVRTKLAHGIFLCTWHS